LIEESILAPKRAASSLDAASHASRATPVSRSISRACMRAV